MVEISYKEQGGQCYVVIVYLCRLYDYFISAIHLKPTVEFRSNPSETRNNCCL